MPNQYTKFRDAAQTFQPLEFKWREYEGKRPTKSRAVRKSTKKTLPRSQTETSSNDEQNATAFGQSKAANALLVYNPSSGLRMDPFRAYPINPDRDELAVLDHFLHLLAPSGKRNLAVLHKQTPDHVDPHINILLPYVMQEAALFDAMLATCQAGIVLSSGLSAYSDHFLMQHRGRGMAALRNKLEQDIDDSALLSVCMFIACDHLIGDLRAVSNHLKALQRMIQLRGELPETTSWQRFVKEGVKGFSSIGCAVGGIITDESVREGPLGDIVDPFRRLGYPQPPFPASLCEKWSFLPLGFAELILGSHISTQLIGIITALDEVRAMQTDNLVEALEMIQPYQGALHRFSQHNEATYLERCLAAGLHAYTFQWPRLQKPNLFHDPLLMGFIRLFSVSYRPRSQREKDAVVWAIMTVQGFLAMRASPLPGSKDVFASALDRFSSLRDWSKITRIFNDFFWTPDLLKWLETCHVRFLEPDRVHKRHMIQDSSPNPVPSTVPPSASTTKISCPVSGQFLSNKNGPGAVCPHLQSVRLNREKS